MVKLWEKSAIAKIAIKRGVLNTNNDRMAEELKVMIPLFCLMCHWKNGVIKFCCCY